MHGETRKDVPECLQQKYKRCTPMKIHTGQIPFIVSEIHVLLVL